MEKNTTFAIDKSGIWKEISSEGVNHFIRNGGDGIKNCAIVKPTRCPHGVLRKAITEADVDRCGEA